MKLLAIILTALLLFSIAGCATMTKTDVIDPQGNIWTVKSKSDALVKVKKPDGTELLVDNRGAPNFFELWIQHLMFKAAPTVELTNKKDDD